MIQELKQGLAALNKIVEACQMGLYQDEDDFKEAIVSQLAKMYKNVNSNQLVEK